MQRELFPYGKDTEVVPATKTAITYRCCHEKTSYVSNYVSLLHEWADRGQIH